MMDTPHRTLRTGRYALLASFDVHGAFDNVSHRQILGGLMQMGVDVNTRRVIHDWVSMRRFQVKMTSSRGTYFSNIYNVTKRLPKEGVLPPLLWLIFCNPVAGRLREERAKKERPEDEGERYDVIIADDIPMLISSPTLGGARKAAARIVRNLQFILRDLQLEINDSKT